MTEPMAKGTLAQSDSKSHQASALRTLNIEKQGIEALMAALSGRLEQEFGNAVDLMQSIGGRVVVTGVGKSGHIGSKIAATFASTGTPAFFVHPAEANHGDLGMIARNDVVLALSWSGETAELKGIINYVKRLSIPMIAVTRNGASTLGKEADVCLELPNEEEACPHGLAPTTSSIMQMALGDSLAIALLESRGFSADDFGIYHPGGSLGASLTRISDVMHTGNEIPLIASGATMRDAVSVMSDKRFGCVGIVDEDGNLAGMITDGDLRRNLSRSIIDVTVDEIMTREPMTASPTMLANSAMAILNEKNITALLVVEDNKPVGLVHMHDLLRIGVA